MTELSIKKRRMLTIFFHGKVIKIAMYSLIAGVFFGNCANAAEGYTQLLRNGTLESAAMDKPLITANNAKKIDKSLTDAQIKKKSRMLKRLLPLLNPRVKLLLRNIKK